MKSVMRIRTWAFTLLATGFGCLLVFGGCSEDEPTADGDTIAPQVSLIAPVEQEIHGVRVQDSILVVIHATDNDRIAQIQLEALFHDETDAVKVGPALTQPDSAGYYSLIWRIGGIENGKEGVLYAVATDAAGNSASSAHVRVQIINQSGVGPPDCDFTVSPPEGPVGEFRFDPTSTRDDIDGLTEILVRWDFDFQGDGLWDTDTSAGRTAGDVVTWTYIVPGNYTVVMEAFNSYYSIPNNRPCRVTREVQVTAAEGQPHPPESQEYVRIPAGTYALGAVVCPGCGVIDYDERMDSTVVIRGTDTTWYAPPPLVRVSNAFRISKREVSNRLYVNYMNVADSLGLIQFDFNSLEVTSTTDQQVLLVLDQGLTRVRYRLADSSYYVDPVYEGHPVTGVSWYGATAWANHYGTRLPTEIEWEIAARGTLQEEGPFYPWNPFQVIDGNYANYRQSGDPFEGGGIERSTTPAGAYGDTLVFSTFNAVSPMGTYDQAGNVAEWIRDWYDQDFYKWIMNEYARRSGNPVTDPASPASGVTRSLRGGSYYSWPEDLRVTNRMSAPPYEKAAWIGFRTAYIEVEP